jgi:hypothetical protein
MVVSRVQLRILALCGALAPIVYVAALVVGGLLDPSYSQIGRTVSEIIERGAPNRDLLNIMFVVYNLLVIPFAIGLHTGLGRGKLRGLIAGCLIAISLLGVVWTLFLPLDEGGKSITQTGMLHLIVGGLVVPFIFIIELGFWGAARKDPRWRRYDLFSLAIFAVTFVFGITTVAFVNSDLRGLFERITTGSFLVWIEVLALKLYAQTTKRFSVFPTENIQKQEAILERENV